MPYNLFISHSWTYGDSYDRLIEMLDDAPNFYYKDYSVPKNDPIHNASYDYQLRAAIRNQMQHASYDLIFADFLFPSAPADSPWTRHRILPE